MNISSEFQILGPMYVMLCWFFVVLEYVTYKFLPCLVEWKDGVCKKCSKRFNGNEL